MKSTEFEFRFLNTERFFAELETRIISIENKVTEILQQKTTPPSELLGETLTTTQVCQKYKVDRKTLRKYAAEEKISIIKLSPKKHQFLKSECDKFFLSAKNKNDEDGK